MTTKITKSQKEKVKRIIKVGLKTGSGGDWIADKVGNVLNISSESVLIELIDANYKATPFFKEINIYKRGTYEPLSVIYKRGR